MFELTLCRSFPNEPTCQACREAVAAALEVDVAAVVAAGHMAVVEATVAAVAAAATLPVAAAIVVDTGAVEVPDIALTRRDTGEDLGRFVESANGQFSNRENEIESGSEDCVCTTIATRMDRSKAVLRYHVYTGL